MSDEAKKTNVNIEYVKLAEVVLYAKELVKSLKALKAYEHLTAGIKELTEKIEKHINELEQ